MVEAGVSAAAVFTEVKDRQLKPFNLTDSGGNPLSGTIPLNSRPVMGAGGFQASARQPFYFASDRFSIAPEGAYGLAWGSTYSTMFWSATATAAVHFLNGNAQIAGKLGYGGYKVESDTTFPETRHGFNLGLEGAMRLTGDMNFVSQVGVTMTSEGPQTAVTFGLQWLFNKRPEPPVTLDDSLGRQSIEMAQQLLDHMDLAYNVLQIMADSGARPGASLMNRLTALTGIAKAFLNGESYTTLPAIETELQKVIIAVDHASNNGITSSNILPLRKRIGIFRQTHMLEIHTIALSLLNEVEGKQCSMAADLMNSGNAEDAAFAHKSLETCIQTLTPLQTLFAQLDPTLPPLARIEVASAQRKLICLLKEVGCTSDMDPEKTVPAIQKRIKAISGGSDADPKPVKGPVVDEKPIEPKKPKGAVKPRKTK